MSILLAILVQGPAAPAAEPPGKHVYVRMDAWLADPGGVADVGTMFLFSDPVGGDSVDLSSDLGLGAEPMLFFRLGIEGVVEGARRARLEFVYGSASWNGRGTLNREVEFDGDVYPAGTEVEGEFWMQYIGLDMAVEWELGEERSFTAGFLMGLDLLRARTRMESEDEESHLSNGDLFLALGGKAGWAPVPAFALGAEARFSFGAVGSIFFDGAASASLRLGPFRLDAGYRYWKFWDPVDNLEVDFDLKGPFASVAVTF